MALPKRSQEINARDHLMALKYWEKMNDMEPIERYKDSKELCSLRPESRVRRREELEIINPRWVMEGVV
jgi:hypothetical protein